MSWPIYCGHQRGADVCTALATVLVQGLTYKAVACARHEAAEVKKAGRGAMTRAVVQPDGARPGNHEPDLLDLIEDGAA